MDGEWTVIALDVGGTKTAGAVVRGRRGGGHPAAAPPPAHQELIVTPTPTATAGECLDGIVAVARRLLATASGRAAAAVGVGVASLVDFARGRVVTSVNLPLADLPLRDLLQEALGLPVAVDNDATVAALGEHRWGAGRGCSEMLMLTLGTGVGGGIICGGRPYRGASGAAAELGHVVVDADGPPCPANCPGRGCLEVYASGPAMAAAARAAAAAAPDSALGRAAAAGEVVDGRLLTRLALEGDEAARAALAGVGERLGVGLVTLVNIFDPEVIVIGGGAAAGGDLLLDPARRVVRERALPPAAARVRIVPAALGAEAGLYGAAALALDECLGPA